MSLLIMGDIEVLFSNIVIGELEGFKSQIICPMKG